ncbi:DUF4867 family protein [bacterium]|nr:DUF4867 family protein [bacterium]
MKIYSVFDKEFKEYGEVVEHIDFTNLLKVLSSKPSPLDGTIYVPSDSDLESLKEKDLIETNIYGGLPIQIGYCNGTNVMLNCLEYHKDSEINIAESDTILLLGRIQEIENGKFDTKHVKAFMIPKGVGVEIYSTTLHYAPVKTDGNFRVIVVLPKGTNLDKPKDAVCPKLYARNKWLLAHSESNEAKNGAYIGLIGENIKVS